jgi:putative effector of murein hydrolase
MPPFNSGHVKACAAAAVVGLAGSVALPVGVAAKQTCATLFGLSATVGGLLLGSMAPPKLKSLLPHPVVTTALCANAGCFLLGALTGMGYLGALKAYLAKGAMAAGAGDILMGFLGSVVLSFGFRIYGQRTLLRRHAAEVLGCASGSALASLLITCAAGRALGLPAPLTLAVAPRSVTVALALPIAAQLGAPAEFLPICAAAVVLTGLVGAALAQKLLDAGGYKDPVTRGLSTAGSAHGLGTAALAASEPEALPFCALAYGLIGIAASSWCAIPPLRVLLGKIAGL